MGLCFGECTGRQLFQSFYVLLLAVIQDMCRVKLIDLSSAGGDSKLFTEWRY